MFSEDDTKSQLGPQEVALDADLPFARPHTSLSVVQRCKFSSEISRSYSFNLAFSGPKLWRQ